MGLDLHCRTALVAELMAGNWVLPWRKAMGGICFVELARTDRIAVLALDRCRAVIFPVRDVIVLLAL